MTERLLALRRQRKVTTGLKTLTSTRKGEDGYYKAYDTNKH